MLVCWRVSALSGRQRLPGRQVFWSLAVIGWVYTVLAARRVAQRQVADLPLAEDFL